MKFSTLLPFDTDDDDNDENRTEPRIGFHGAQDGYFSLLNLYPTQRWKRRCRLHFSTIDADVLNFEKQFVKLAFIAVSSCSEKVHAHNTFEFQNPNPRDTVSAAGPLCTHGKDKPGSGAPNSLILLFRLR